MKLEEFIDAQAEEDKTDEEILPPEELDVQKAVVESLAADKAIQDEQIVRLTGERDSLSASLDAANRRIAELESDVEKFRRTLEGYGDVLAKNEEENTCTQITLLERHEELNDRFDGESRDHVLEALKEARDAAEREGRVRRAQVLEGVLVANEPVGELAKRRAAVEKLFRDNGNILSGVVLEELQREKIAHRNGEEYLLPDEILKRNF